jgi:hypothetical protein
LYLGLAHETLARVALALGDDAAFEREAELCYEAYGCYRNPALLAKHRRLRQAFERRRPQPQAASGSEERVFTRNGIPVAQALAACIDTGSRARAALDILIQEVSAIGGYLFILGVEQAECLAAVGGEPSPDLVAEASDYLLAQTKDAPTTSSESGSASRREWRDSYGRRCAPVLLSHELPDSWVVTGVALLAFAENAQPVNPVRIATAISHSWALEDVSTLLYPNEV